MSNIDNVSKTLTEDQQLALQKEYRSAKLRFKTIIAANSVKQKHYSEQRKTVKLKGDRMMSADIATARHSGNRWELRHLYLAYAIMRTIYGGYTKLHFHGHAEPAERTLFAATLLSGQQQMLGIDHKFLQKLISDNGPKAILF